MRAIYLTFLGLLISCGPNVERNSQNIDNAPRLVVVVTIDQMRDDFFDIYGANFQGGFRRILDEGKRYENAWVDHAPTNSYPGHASIATGAYPKNHGFIDNSWKMREQGEWRRVYASDLMPHDCAPDGSGGEGSGLEVPTLGERVVGAGGKFISISASRSIARIYAGKARAPVLWLSPEDDGFITNACHQAGLPAWVTTFNEQQLPDYVTGRWDLSVPENVLRTLRPDDSVFEGEGASASFPHIMPDDEENALNWFYDTPAADEAALAFSLRAIEAEGIGQDRIPDLLNIVINTIDNVGHRYGPLSVEQADNLFKLDENLGAFMARLDELVGEDNWVLVLTGDHGAAPAPESMPNQLTARRVTEDEVNQVIAAAYEAADQFAEGDPERSRAAAAAVESFDFVERVYIDDEVIEAAANGDETASVYANSFIEGHYARHPFYDSNGKGLADLGLTPVLKEYVVVNWATSIHGSHYDYDREVPIIFYGAGVTPGRSDEFARTIDITPTLMELIGIQPMMPLDGRVLPVGVN